MCCDKKQMEFIIDRHETYTIKKKTPHLGNTSIVLRAEKFPSLPEG